MNTMAIADPKVASPLMRALASRINEEDTSYRTKMVEIAAKLECVIAMGRGDPDFRTPEHIAEAARQAITDDRTHYTHPHRELQVMIRRARRPRRAALLDDLAVRCHRSARRASCCGVRARAMSP